MDRSSRSACPICGLHHPDGVPCEAELIEDQDSDLVFLDSLFALLEASERPFLSWEERPREPRLTSRQETDGSWTMLFRTDSAAQAERLARQIGASKRFLVSVQPNHVVAVNVDLDAYWRDVLEESAPPPPSFKVN